MNYIDINQPNGFPEETNTFDFLQTAFSLFNKLGAIVGNKGIVEGCTVTGSTVSNGVIYLNGELIEFRGGSLQSKIVIKEDVTEVEFEDKVIRPAYYTRYATFGTGTEAINWSDFKRVDNLIALVARIKNIEDVDLLNLQGQINTINEIDIVSLQTQINALNAVPVGIISMWAGVVEDIPAGWFICDGTNGTPDLIGRFIVGFDPDNDDNDYNTIGNKGGAKSVTLTETQMPSHNHSGSANSAGAHTHSYRKADYYGDASDYDRGGAGGTKANTTGSAGSHTHSLTVNSKGGGESHENRPPYYTLAYIQFKGE